MGSAQAYKTPVHRSENELAAVDSYNIGLPVKLPPGFTCHNTFPEPASSATRCPDHW